MCVCVCVCVCVFVCVRFSTFCNLRGISFGFNRLYSPLNFMIKTCLH